MNEDFLHYVWKYKLFLTTALETTLNETVTILKAGLHNTNAGPDFLNAKIKIDNQVWVGNIEIHTKASDWYVHNHEVDANYDAVILHVVWEDDATIFMKNNKPLPTLVLKNRVDKLVLDKYRNLFFKKEKWIPCESEIGNTALFILNNWKERLFFERLERKSLEIKTLLVQEKANFEVVLFQLLAKNFGLKVNGDAFLQLATNLNFSLVRKYATNETSLAALFFGQAGFLERNLETVYYTKLQTEYNYLQHKHKLVPMAKHQFSFFRMRPANFPSLRIAQLVALYYLHRNLFAKLIEIDTITGFYTFFSADLNSFWKTHYTFEKTTKPVVKKLTKPFVDLLIINTIIPLKFLYQQQRSGVDKTSFLNVLGKMKAEKNSIITKFSELKITAKNAFETQALLELKNEYCTQKSCLECAIGITILKR